MRTREPWGPVGAVAVVLVLAAGVRDCLLALAAVVALAVVLPFLFAIEGVLRLGDWLGAWWCGRGR